MRRYVMLAVLAGVLSGCATAAQRQAQQMGQSMATARDQATACFGQINSDPAYTDLLERHSALKDVHLATLAQQTDPSYVTQREVDLLSERRERGMPCRQVLIDGYKVAPTVDVLWTELYARHDAALIQLIKRQITWGEYITSSRAIFEDETAKMQAAGRRIDAELNAEHRQETAQRAAAAQAFSNAMYQQQLLNQNQQAINAANRPVTTNCNRFGNSVNCTSY